MNWQRIEGSWQQLINKVIVLTAALGLLITSAAVPGAPGNTSRSEQNVELQDRELIEVARATDTSRSVRRRSGRTQRGSVVFDELRAKNSGNGKQVRVAATW